jgi:hypothetical protein
MPAAAVAGTLAGVRRLLRIASAAFAAASLLSCAAVLALWVRTGFAADRVVLPTEDAQWELGTHRGYVEVYRIDGAFARSASLAVPQWERDAYPPRSDVRPLADGQWVFAAPGLGVSHLATPERGTIISQFVIHLAYPASICAVGPLAWLIARGRRRRAGRLGRANRCRQCGYDLRSTPDASGPPLSTCPECGAASGTIAVAP